VQLSIQIRILKQVQRAEVKRQADTQDLLRAIQGILPSTAQATPPQIEEALRLVRARQNQFDAVRDAADLRMLMRGAIQAGDDKHMIEVLQVEREEMPEAIKTLQRALERLSIGPGLGTTESREATAVSIDAPGSPQPQRTETSATLDSQRGSSAQNKAGRFGGSNVDTLDREFLESGIDALTRISLSRGVRVEDLPSWTITRSVFFFWSYFCILS
jgi:abelson tyrosine-protein kinase 1